MQSHRPSSAERFLSAWIRLENDLTSRYRDATSTSRADTTSVLRWAERTHLLSPGAVDFALHCRDARNAYAHVCFDGYDGPVTNPPSEVTQRLERLAATLRDPVHATSLAAVATTCEASCRLDQALAVMHKNDFSQLPYHYPASGWLLITREQVSRWLEVAADEDGAALLDLHTSVGALADDPRIGPVVPRILQKGTTVSRALDQLELALSTPDSEPGGYAFLLLLGPTANHAPHVLTSDDLPRLYDLLGR
jgi:hypothetical protein